ncbi:virulence RhuM family protein [Pseudomonas sp. C27(2019)]|uniref:virulence RhuM family protein n=1 Tax=Pseudomonas sp. C27(2019) TaxID=2604941 RepID=UPI001C49C8F0|nr:virulence RhuM family protein [Pseudomonas sp. C27(2019)]
MPTANQNVQIFTSSDGKAHLEVALDQDTVWLSQAQMGQLFDTTPENVLVHLKNIFKDAELQDEATTKDFLVVRQEGLRQVRRSIKHYNLDAIISVGYQ